MEGRSYLCTTAADSTAGKVCDKTKDQTDMMKLMTDMQKQLSDLQKDVNQLKNEKFRPRKFDNIPRFNYGRGQVYGQNYGRGQGYGHNFGRGDGHRQNVGRGQETRKNKYRVNPQKENSQTDKKSGNVGRGRGRARPLRSEVTTHQSSIQGSIGVSSAAQEAGMCVEADIHQVKCKMLVDTGATVSIVSNDIYQKIPDVARPALTSTNQEVLTVSGDKLKILCRGNFLMRLDDTKDIVVQALVAQITVDGIICLDCLRSNVGLIDLQNSMLEVDGRRVSLKYAGKLGCFRVVAHDKVVMPAQSEMIIRGAVDDSANKLTYETDMLVEANETFLKKDKALVGRSLVQASKNVFVRVMNPSAETEIIYPGTIVAHVSPVQEVVNPNSKIDEEGELRTDLINLLERTQEHLIPKQSSEVKRLLKEYEGLFAASDSDYGRTSVVKHNIATGYAHPIKQPLRRLPDVLAKEVSSSPWSSPGLLVRKKNGTTRFCVYYRRLNAVIINDAYPLPRIDDSFDHLSGSCCFSTLDLCLGYWQVECEGSDRHKTAFATRSGLYEFRVMPFGLKGAPATFERLMETVLAGLQWNICLIYLDDIIVLGRSFEDMVTNLKQVYDRLLAAGL